MAQQGGGAGEENGKGESKEKEGKKTILAPTLRRLTRTKPTPQPLVKDDSTDEISLPNAELHKYTTIQSLRPEEVKELLSQHFLDQINGKTSMPNEAGERRFSLVKNNFKQRRAFRNSKDAATLRGIVDEGGEVGKSSSAPDSNNPFLKLDPDEAQKHAAMSDGSDGELDAAHEIARLRAQLVHERTIYTREMARMRAQLRAYEAHLAQTVVRMGSLLEMVDSRERSVQSLLAKSLENAEDEKGGDKENKNELGGEKENRNERGGEKENKNERGGDKETKSEQRGGGEKVDMPAIKTFDLLS